jgi:hypothetical protein
MINALYGAPIGVVAGGLNWLGLNADIVFTFYEKVTDSVAIFAVAYWPK